MVKLTAFSLARLIVCFPALRTQCVLLIAGGLQCVALLVLTSPATARFQIVDDFQSYIDGDFIDGKGAWNAEVQSAVSAGVAADPLQESNLVLSIGDGLLTGRLGARETFNDSPLLPISNGTTATLFFRLHWSDEQSDMSIGMTDVTDPICPGCFNPFDQFESQLTVSFAQGHDQLIIRNGAEGDTLTPDVVNGTWYDVWMVIDNERDSTEVYLQGGVFASQTQLTSGGVKEFTFRNSVDAPQANDLRSLFIATGRNTSNEPPRPTEHIGPALLDDIYISNGRNLARPNDPARYLRIDFQHDNVVDTQPGFEPFVVEAGSQGGTQTFSDNIQVTVSARNVDLVDTRHRAIPTDSGDLTQSALLRDKVFAFDKGEQGGINRGLDVLVEGLAPSQEYELTVWSWDQLTGGLDNRASAWFLGEESEPFIEYSFDATLPTSNQSHSFTTVATSSADGELVLQGRRLDTSVNANGDFDHGVFLNALQLVEVVDTETGRPTFYLSPYLSQADSPFNLSAPDATFFLEDFEDGELNVPGVEASNGDVRSPSDLTDSVDGDDGSIDGSGLDGWSFLHRPGMEGIGFDFEAIAEFGGLPTHAGVVWTDGVNQITFEAFDQNGHSLGVNTGAHSSDPACCGLTDEDRFYGVVHDRGISRIEIRTDGTANSGIEVDHLQYGVLAVFAPGDFNSDGDVDSADRTILTQNWTGARQSGAGKGFREGDTDRDGDVDSADQTALVTNWTGAQLAGNIEDGNDADLIYDPATGGVTVDASGTVSQQIISFVLGSDQNDMRPDNLAVSADGSAGPFFDVGTNTDATTFQIGQTDPLNQKAGPVIDLGNIFPAGMDLAGLSEYLTLADYASALGEGGTMDLVVVPEPSNIALMLLGVMGLVARRRRK